VYTVQRAVERLGPGQEKFTIIYDTCDVKAWNMDLIFTRELFGVFAEAFPERLRCVVVINNSWLVLALWALVRPFLDPVTRDKIHFSTDIRETLLDVVDENHPYFRYAMQVSELSDAAAAQVPLPPASPYVPRWKEAIKSDERFSTEANGAPAPDERCSTEANGAPAPAEKRPPLKRRIADILAGRRACCTN